MISNFITNMNNCDTFSYLSTRKHLVNLESEKKEVSERRKMGTARKNAKRRESRTIEWPLEVQVSRVHSEEYHHLLLWRKVEHAEESPSLLYYFSGQIDEGEWNIERPRKALLMECTILMIEDERQQKIERRKETNERIERALISDCRSEIIFEK